MKNFAINILTELASKLFLDLIYWIIDKCNLLNMLNI